MSLTNNAAGERIAGPEPRPAADAALLDVRRVAALPRVDPKEFSDTLDLPAYAGLDRFRARPMRLGVRIYQDTGFSANVGSAAASENWFSSVYSGKSGHPEIYSSQAILLLPVLREVYNLPLRALQGFTESLFKQMGLAFPVPSYKGRRT